MKIPRQIAFAACLFAVTLAASERPRSSYDPAQQHPIKQHDSLIDFALKRINPIDKDYGQWIEQARRNAIEASLDTLPRLLSVGLLIVSFAVIIHQSGERHHREIIAARFLAWYHNELVHTRETARETIARNQGLKMMIDERAEAEPAPKTALAVPKSAAPSAGNGATCQALASPKTASIADHDLVTEINKLRQKVVAQEDTEKALRLQISQLNTRLQDEKQKNRTLKGQ